MPSYDPSSLDRDIVRLALRGDVDMKRYLLEVLALCARLDIDEPPWIEDPDVAERLALNGKQYPKRSR